MKCKKIEDNMKDEKLWIPKRVLIVKDNVDHIKEGMAELAGIAMDGFGTSGFSGTQAYAPGTVFFVAAEHMAQEHKLLNKEQGGTEHGNITN
jgi:hypothetical protein